MSNLPLVISSIPVRQDSQGRYCLNDLHKASGNNENNRPSKFVRTFQTKALITEINQSPNMGFGAVKAVRGGNGRGGTYACKELVYAYAMWISASFSLKVIRAYDSIVTEQKPLPTPETTLDSLIPETDTIQTLEGLIYRSIKEPFAIRAFISIEKGKASYVKQLSASEIIFNVDALEGLFDALAVLSKDHRIINAQMASRQAKNKR